MIYLHVPEAKRFYMIDIYGKDEKDDLSTADKREFSRFAVAVKAEAVAQYRRWLQENDR